MGYKNLKPWLDQVDTQYFEDALRSCVEYLEFGSGGSTLFADKICNSVVSVETDKQFVISIEPYCKNTKFIFVDIGPVRNNGKPTNKVVFGFPYYTAPWKYTNSPDLILIDGRFRISTLCYSLINTKPGTRILFDDITHSKYQIIQELPIKYKKISRMGEFISPTIKPYILYEYMFKYTYDWN